MENIDYKLIFDGLENMDDKFIFDEDYEAVENAPEKTMEERRRKWKENLAEYLSNDSFKYAFDMASTLYYEYKCNGIRMAPINSGMIYLPRGNTKAYCKIDMMDFFGNFYTVLCHLKNDFDAKKIKDEITDSFPIKDEKIGSAVRCCFIDAARYGEGLRECDWDNIISCEKVISAPTITQARFTLENIFRKYGDDCFSSYDALPGYLQDILGDHWHYRLYGAFYTDYTEFCSRFDFIYNFRLSEIQERYKKYGTWE